MRWSATHGVGLGLRRELLRPLLQHPIPQLDFFEVAPENWMQIGGKQFQQFCNLAQDYPLICHGLSLSLGSLDPLDAQFIAALKKFFNEFSVCYYSEHLSYSSFAGHLYDLLPLPFTEEAVIHVAKRICQVQELLEQTIAIENISYYNVPFQQMSEQAFMLAVVAEAKCDILLDINNIYVNSQNHQYDPYQYLDNFTDQSVCYYHVAGHYVEPDGFIIDSHGQAVIEPVWQLLDYAYKTIGVRATLLERDNHIPSLHEIKSELSRIQQVQQSNIVLEQPCLT